MNRDIIEAELIACIGFCVNDWNYGNKDILVLNTPNIALLQMLSRLPNVCIHYINKANIPNIHEILPNINLYAQAIELKHNEFDFIIDLANNTPIFFNKVLKENGILIINLANLHKSKDSLEEAKEQINNANFHIKMPFCIEGQYYLFLSNKIHPLADICLHKIDMIENLTYYNAKIHEAVFAMPNYLKNNLRGIIKN